MGLGEGGCKGLQTSQHLSKRFRLCHWGTVALGGCGIGTIYGHSGLGLKRGPNLELLQEVAAVVLTWKGPWILGGDFNATAEELQQTGWLNLVGGHVHAPAVPTCGDRVIDYVVVSANLTHAVRGVHTICDVECYPHSAVR